MIAHELKNSNDNESYRAPALARALTEQKVVEPLSESTATTFAALAISECHVNLLIEVLKRAPKIDWTLGEYGLRLARQAVNNNWIHSSEPKDTVGALALSRLSQAHLESRYYSGDVVSMTQMLTHIPQACEQAALKPCPQAWVGCSSTEVISLARKNKRWFGPDESGQTVAHLWAHEAKNHEAFDKVRRLLASPLAPMVSALDHEGLSPLEILRTKKLPGASPSLSRLNMDFAKWEALQLSKSVKRRPAKDKLKSSLLKRL